MQYIQNNLDDLLLISKTEEDISFTKIKLFFEQHLFMISIFFLIKLTILLLMFYFYRRIFCFFNRIYKFCLLIEKKDNF